MKITDSPTDDEIRDADYVSLCDMGLRWSKRIGPVRPFSPFVDDESPDDEYMALYVIVDPADTTAVEQWISRIESIRGPRPKL